MAYRVNITETVESAAGLNITGASVVVRFHGGAQAPVYDSETGGSVQAQPLTTVNGKILAAGTTPVWAAEGDYDLDVSFGSDATTFFLPLRRGLQFVTTLEASPEDGELSVELYDAANGGAWLKRYRAAAAAWDMIGGPPPATAVLPGSPRTRQEIYLTGGTPAVQHLRFNGASWDYVGTPPTVPVSGSPFTLLNTGQFGQKRAGRQLTAADFSTLLALPTTPVGIFNLGDTSNLGSAGALTNKGSVQFATGIEGIGNSAARFDGSTSQSLYFADTGAGDPYRLRTFSMGCWFKTAKRGVTQILMAKGTNAGTVAGLDWALYVSTISTVSLQVSDGTTASVTQGVADVSDDNWHQVVGTYDGNDLRIYLDGEQEGVLMGASLLVQQIAAPFSIAAEGADGSNNGISPFFGRIDEAFVTSDVMSPDQVRLLYAAKIPHGYSSTPNRAFMRVARKARGAAFATSDFPSQPLRLYNFTAGALTDAGTNGQALSANVAATPLVGADGAAGNGYWFPAAATSSLSSTDTGLPSGTSARTFGAWFKTTQNGSGTIMAWGGAINVAEERLGLAIQGSQTVLTMNNGTTATASGYGINDGKWHFAVVVADNSAVDGLKHKLYLDGKCVASDPTALVSVTLTGANRFRIGMAQDGTNPMVGSVTGAFVHSAALTAEQIWTLYQKSSQALPSSPVDPNSFIEAIDATNVYFIGSDLEDNQVVDLAVAA